VILIVTLLLFLTKYTNINRKYLGFNIVQLLYLNQGGVNMEKKRILLIDDSRDVTMLVEALLKYNNYDVDTALTASEGIRKSETRHDLILLDRTLPDIEGLEVCRMLRKKENLKQVPIIFLTGCDTVQDITDGLYIGGDDYVTKPFDNKELLARIEVALRRKDSFQETLSNQQAVMQELVKIIKEEKVASFFQPIFDSKSKAAFGFEVTSSSPLNSVLNNPRQLFDASLRTGLYEDLESLCWRKAFRRWKDSGTGTGNLFMKCLPPFIENKRFDSSFIGNIGADSERVIVELNASKMPGNMSVPLDGVKGMKSEGIKVSVSNFGEGPLTIRDVSEVNPDFLKINLSVLEHVKSEDYKQRLIRTTTQMCHNQGIQVIIGGIEYDEDRDFVESIGVDYIQGNLFCSSKQKVSTCQYLCKEHNKCQKGYQHVN